jgi:hypothetical protein
MIQITESARMAWPHAPAARRKAGRGTEERAMDDLFDADDLLMRAEAREDSFFDLAVDEDEDEADFRLAPPPLSARSTPSPRA